MPYTNGKRISITTAVRGDGLAIAALLDASHYHPRLLEFIDWMDLGGYWQKAVREGALVGCMQMIFARPVSRLEYIAVAENLAPYVQAKIVRELLNFGCQVLADNGAQAVSGTVPFALKVAKRQLRKHGAIATEQGNIMTKRLT